MEKYTRNDGYHQLHVLGVEIYPTQEMSDGIVYCSGKFNTDEVKNIVKDMLEDSGIDKDPILKEVTDEKKQECMEIAKKVIKGI